MEPVPTHGLRKTIARLLISLLPNNYHPVHLPPLCTSPDSKTGERIHRTPKQVKHPTQSTHTQARQSPLKPLHTDRLGLYAPSTTIFKMLLKHLARPGRCIGREEAEKNRKEKAGAVHRTGR